MTRTSTELPRLEPESSASTNSAMAAKSIDSIMGLNFHHNIKEVSRMIENLGASMVLCFHKIQHLR